MIEFKYPNKFPAEYQNTFPYWGFFTKEQISSGQLLMLDLDFGELDTDGQVRCSLNCPPCFRRKNIVDHSSKPRLTLDELLKVIDQAQDLGLQSVKICGDGEPTEAYTFLTFLREMTKRDIGVAIFTKGQVLGSDEKTRQFNPDFSSALDLCEEIYSLKISVMLGYQSFSPAIQDTMVGVKGHTILRDQALENLITAGFTSTNPSRLCLCNAPITQKNDHDAFGIYVFTRRLGAYPVLALSMVSGDQFTPEFILKNDLPYEHKLKLWTKIYSWNIQQRIQTMDQIREEGISAMPGSHPCNQIAVGLYVTANGSVVHCPGFKEILGNVRDEPLKTIWERVKKYELRQGEIGCGCPPKEGMVENKITLPPSLYVDVLRKLEETQGRK